MWIDPPATISAPEPTEPTMMTSPSSNVSLWPDRTDSFNSIVGACLDTTLSATHSSRSLLEVSSLAIIAISSALVSRLSPAAALVHSAALEEYRRCCCTRLLPIAIPPRLKRCPTWLIKCDTLTSSWHEHH